MNLLKQAYRHPFEFVSPKLYIEEGSSLEQKVKHTSAYATYVPEFTFFFDDQQEWNVMQKIIIAENASH
jgi:hypothetical protein